MAIVTNETEFMTAIADGEPEITVANDITLTSLVSITYTVSVTGEEDAVLFCGVPLSSSAVLFRISETGRLTIGSLTVDGDARDCTLVQVNGGTFIMEDGAVLKNISSMSGKRAVIIGALTFADGGTFIMNGGLITEVDAHEAVNGYGGTIEMHNDASIRDNSGAAITISRIYTAPETRSTLIMTGKSSIMNNSSRQVGGAGIIVASDVIMGVNEGDEPIISGNQSPDMCGGLMLAEGSSLTMRYGAEISDNYAPDFSGGVIAQDSDVYIGGSASIKNNRTDGYSGGLTITRGNTSVIEGEAEISGNSSKDIGGGIYMQFGATLEMKGNATVRGNTAVDGAGIYLNASSASIGLDNSLCAIYNNAAEGLGGGVFISEGSSLLLTGRADIYGNTATEGAGIYKAGELNLSRAPRVSDGLFFDDLSAGSPERQTQGAPQPAQDEAALVVGYGGAETTGITPVITKKMYETSGAAGGLQQSLGFVPCIVDILAGGSEIKLEQSGYVSPANVPLVIAEKGPAYEQLCETDREAWLIPPEFGPGYAVVLNYELDWVMIDYDIYQLSYLMLYGGDNPNPDSYSLESEFPIVLLAPGERLGYIFTGWCDANGEPVTEIAEGTTGNIVLIATWREEEKYCLAFDGNAPCVTDVPEPFYAEEGVWVNVPATIPKKPCHCFVEWNTEPLGGGADYGPGAALLITRKDITLYALWRPICRHYEKHGDAPYCPKKNKCRQN